MRRVIVDGEDRTELYARMLFNMKLMGMQNRINARFDRCCHPAKPSDGTLMFRRLIREARL